MKICTDSCLFGAWIAAKIEQRLIEPKTILDIGSGTGLLSLMVAQKSGAEIDAVEIDENSFLQTQENFMESPWSHRLHAFHCDIKSLESAVKYDLIICNPPFFQNDLKSVNAGKNLAKHPDGLRLTELTEAIKQHLSEKGNFSVILPFHRIGYFKSLAAEKQFCLIDELLVRQTPDHTYFRGILFFGTEEGPAVSRELIIKEKTPPGYTKSFDRLLKDYYL